MAIHAVDHPQDVGMQVDPLAVTTSSVSLKIAGDKHSASTHGIAPWYYASILTPSFMGYRM